MREVGHAGQCVNGDGYRWKCEWPVSSDDGNVGAPAFPDPEPHPWRALWEALCTLGDHPDDDDARDQIATEVRRLAEVAAGSLDPRPGVTPTFGLSALAAAGHATRVARHHTELYAQSARVSIQAFLGGVPHA